MFQEVNKLLVHHPILAWIAVVYVGRLEATMIARVTRLFAPEVSGPIPNNSTCVTVKSSVEAQSK